MSNDPMIAAARAALNAGSAEGRQAVFALHEESPLAAAMLMLEVASGRMGGATESAQARAADLARSLDLLPERCRAVPPPA